MHEVFFHSVFELVITLVLLFLICLIVSIPVYVASKVLVPERSKIENALAASALGLIVFFVIAFVFFFFFPPIGILLGFFGILGSIAFVYRVGFLKALGISIIAFAIFVISWSILFAIGFVFIGLF